jgi:hypothetical protein
VSTPVPSGSVHPPVRTQPRHLAGSLQAWTPPPVDPDFPDYPFFLDHDPEARSRHLYGTSGRRWGRHPGWPALDTDQHLPAGDRARGLEPMGSLGTVALVAGGVVTAAAWLIAVLQPPVEVIGFLSVGWALAYLVTCMWLEVAHGNAVALTAGRMHRTAPRWVWLGWFVPFAALWTPKWIVDDTLWSLSRAALVHRLRWTGWWWTSFVLSVLLWSASVAVELVPASWLDQLPSWTGTPLELAVGLRVGAAVACTIALVLWVPIVRRLAMISDQLADLKRSTLVR